VHPLALWDAWLCHDRPQQPEQRYGRMHYSSESRWELDSLLFRRPPDRSCPQALPWLSFINHWLHWVVLSRPSFAPFTPSFLSIEGSPPLHKACFTSLPPSTPTAFHSERRLHRIPPSPIFHQLCLPAPLRSILQRIFCSPGPHEQSEHLVLWLVQFMARTRYSSAITAPPATGYETQVRYLNLRSKSTLNRPLPRSLEPIEEVDEADLTEDTLYGHTPGAVCPKTCPPLRGAQGWRGEGQRQEDILAMAANVVQDQMRPTTCRTA